MHSYDDIQQMFAIVLLYTVAICCIIGALVSQIEKVENRLKDVTNALMIAEFQTGIPYYTSLKSNPYYADKPEWLYEHQRKKIQAKNQCVGKN